jgi:hypothetical protein
MDSYTYEKSVPIVINQSKNSEYSKDLGLNNAIIDPFKMSPPNSFMKKLAKRMDYYYSRNVHNSSSPFQQPMYLNTNYVTVSTDNKE